MSSALAIQQRVTKNIQVLPPGAQEELLNFLNYLQYKYRLDRRGDVVQLGGLWADVDLDVDNDDIRALRQRVTAQLLSKVCSNRLSD